MKWTTEKPTIPGWYWRRPPGAVAATVACLTNLKDAEGFAEGGSWAGPIEPPAVPSTMYFTKPRRVGHGWCFLRFKDRNPETEERYGPFGSEIAAERALDNEVRLFSPDYTCVRSQLTLAPDPTQL